MKTKTQNTESSTKETIFAVLYLMSFPTAIAYYCINFL